MTDSYLPPGPRLNACSNCRAGQHGDCERRRCACRCPRVESGYGRIDEEDAA